MTLAELGWTEELETAFTTYSADGFEPARVVAEHRGGFAVRTERDDRLAHVRGKLREEELFGGMPTVGDWVAVVDAGERYAIEAVLPRRTKVSRKTPWLKSDEHVLVANVDTIFIVTGLDGDFNVRRLERYLTLVHASGVAPIVVLTKADIAAADPASAARFAHVACCGQTLVLLGSSGAGKSTLTNTLIGSAVQDTGAVREHDSRGMHTTTARSLHLLPGGACVIDTPGLRTLRPDIDEATLAASFGDVEALAPQCRFRDCRHGDEPGCAVREGIDPDRLRNFHKLLRETRRDSLTWVERRQQLAAWKSRGKDTRMRMKLKRGDG